MQPLKTFLNGFLALSREGLFAAGWWPDPKGRIAYAKKEKAVTDAVLDRHLSGKTPIGVYASQDGMTRLGLIDGDDHDGVMPWLAKKPAMAAVARELNRRGLKFFAERSGGGDGFHFFVFWKSPQPVSRVHRLILSVVKASGFTPGTNLAKGQLEVFPTADAGAPGSFGNLTALPFSRKSTAICTETWEPIDLATYVPPPFESLLNDDIDDTDALLPVTPGPKKGGGVAEVWDVTQELLNAVRCALAVVDSDDRKVWIDVGLALKASLDDDGYPLFEEWSAKADTYKDEADCLKTWDGLKPSGSLGLDMVFSMAMRKGWRPNRKVRRAARKKRVLSPASPLRSAGKLLEDWFTDPDGRTLAFTQGAFWTYQANRYVEMDDEELRGDVYEYLDGRVYTDQKGRNVTFNPRPGDVSAVIDATKPKVLVKAKQQKPPYWRGDAGSKPSPTELIPFRNGLLHVPTGEFLPPTSQYFGTYVLDFNYAPDAPPPTAFLSFLESVWPNDPAMISLLQEIVGYLLSPDTSQQKMFLIIGPSRAGKGTVIRAVTTLIGQENVASLQMSELADTFALESLIGVPVAVLPDARLSGRVDKTRIVERLLPITGEDSVSVRRMYRPNWIGRLPTRFVIVTNEIPNLNDESGALANRVVPLVFERSFVGREDIGLSARFEAERPGMFNWALEGLRRLKARGRFELPAASLAKLEQVQEATSQAKAFMRERCIVDPKAQVGVDMLYLAYTHWAQARGAKMPMVKARFGAALSAAEPALVRKQIREESGTRPYVYQGLRLLTQAKVGDIDDLDEFPQPVDPFEAI